MSGTYCSFCDGKCEFNNTDDCPNQPVLRHCHVLRQKYRKEKEGADASSVSEKA